MFGNRIECSKCHGTESSYWKKVDNVIMCIDCFVKHKSKEIENETLDKKDRSKIHSADKNAIKSYKRKYCDVDVKDMDDSSKNCKDTPSKQKCNKEKKEECNSDKSKKDDNSEDDSKRDTRRKTRRGKLNNNFPKGRSRRSIFKKNVIKSPAPISQRVTSDCLVYRGHYWQNGDIVSFLDVDGGKYYAQIRGLLQDQYCEKSAVITWLLPTVHSPSPDNCFDPSTYIIGPEEELPRKLEYMEFVCHAPSEYYKLRNSPYPTSAQPSTGVIWTRMPPVHTGSS